MPARTRESERLDLGLIADIAIRLHLEYEGREVREPFLARPEDVAKRARALGSWHSKMWYQRGAGAPAEDGGAACAPLLTGPAAEVPRWAWLAAAYLIYAVDYYGYNYELLCQVSSSRVAELLVTVSRSPLERPRPALASQLSRLGEAPFAGQLVRFAEIDCTARRILQDMAYAPVESAMARDALVVWLRRASAQCAVLETKFAPWPWWGDQMRATARRMDRVYRRAKRFSARGAARRKLVAPAPKPVPVRV